jgi:hypothetical protein
MSFNSELIAALQDAYSRAGNSEDGVAMQAYQKDISKFLGIRTPFNK